MDITSCVSINPDSNVWYVLNLSFSEDFMSSNLNFDEYNYQLIQDLRGFVFESTLCDAGHKIFEPLTLRVWRHIRTDPNNKLIQSSKSTKNNDLQISLRPKRKQKIFEITFLFCGSTSKVKNFEVVQKQRRTRKSC